MTLIFVLFLGLAVGSFLNVCIFRIPESLSIVSPPSRCPKCLKEIRFYDNIPVFSYLILRGKCRFCNEPISFRYPMIEIMTAMFAVCVVLKYGVSIQALVYFLFIATLIVITFIDMDHQIIPDVLSIPGIFIFFAAAVLIDKNVFVDSLIGILSGGGILLIIAWLYKAVAKREGMGGGDIKLISMIGALLGWKGVLVTVFISSVVGTLTGLVVMLYTRADMKLAIPFGPFLAIGAICFLFFGDTILAWYL